jgi:hypothetical protein
LHAFFLLNIQGDILQKVFHEFSENLEIIIFQHKKYLWLLQNNSLSEAQHPWHGSPSFRREGRVRSQENHVGFVGQSAAETGLSSGSSVYPSQFIIPPI